MCAQAYSHWQGDQPNAQKAYQHTHKAHPHARTGLPTLAQGSTIRAQGLPAHTHKGHQHARAGLPAHAQAYPHPFAQPQAYLRLIAIVAAIFKHTERVAEQTNFKYYEARSTSAKALRLRYLNSPVE